MGLLGLVALVLGMIGFVRNADAAGEPIRILDSLYLSIQLFVLQSGAVPPPLPWELEVSRLLAPAVAGYTAISAMAVLFREQLRRLQTLRLSDHVVVCGLGRKGMLLVRSLRERGIRVVVIEGDAENDQIETIRGRGSTVFVGDARDPDLLRRAGIARAGHVVAVTGDDGVNAEIAVRARRLAQADRPLGCLVHVVDPQLCTLLRMQEIGGSTGGPFRLDFFNVFEAGARELLAEFPPFAEGRPRHAVIVGLGRMGESVLVQAVRNWRAGDAGGDRPVITVVDRVAGDKVESLRLRLPRLASIVTLDACEFAIGSPEFERAEFLFAPDGRPDVSAVYVCVDDDSLGMSAALSLHRHLRGHDVPVVVRMVHDAGLASLLHGRGAAEGGFETLHAFGLLDRTCSADLLLGTNEVLARAMHEEYRRTRRGDAGDPARNPSMAPWRELPETLKESNRDQAANIGAKLSVVGCDLAPLDGQEAAFEFSPDEVEMLGRVEHDRWVRERLRGGWTYAPGEKDVQRKTTPYLVSWEELPEAVKEDDRIFARRLPAFLAGVGFRIVRVGMPEEVRGWVSTRSRRAPPARSS